MSQIIKLKAGKYKIPCVIDKKGPYLFVSFPFNRTLLDDIKCMKGSKWLGFEEPPQKLWRIDDCFRNQQQLRYLSGINIYENYDKPLFDVQPNRGKKSQGGTCMSQQVEGLSHILTRRQCILAHEMGAGKSLTAIEAMELSGKVDWWWVGPKSALVAVQYEFKIWKSFITPVFMTYDRLRKIVTDKLIDEAHLPEGIIFDESTKLKSPTAQRSQAADIITEAMRAKDPNCFIVLMTGAPSPKSPADWWHQCEVACPGFVREGNIDKFKARLCLIKQEESISGGVYPKLITWLDNSSKCQVCGQLANEHVSGQDSLVIENAISDHAFEPSINEVANLYKRMNGLVHVKFKKDCLRELPDKVFRLIRVDPNDSTLRAADLILASSTRAVQALISLRELSDGFQYAEEETGETEPCPRCFGHGVAEEFFDPENEGETVSPEAIQSGRCKSRQMPCEHCGAKGTVAILSRVAKEVPCPKEQLLIDLLDEYEDIGRFVIYAGFEASIDRCVRVSLRYGWDVLRVDGRGWVYYNSGGEQKRYSNIEMLSRFQEVTSKDSPDKLVFVGQPGAAGMGLTLTASPVEFFYSNTFNGEDRIQAMERIHRPGMDTNKGATIIDCIHLPIDEKILENLQKKIDLQSMTMGQIRELAGETTVGNFNRIEDTTPRNIDGVALSANEEDDIPF